MTVPNQTRRKTAIIVIAVLLVAVFAIVFLPKLPMFLNTSVHELAWGSWQARFEGVSATGAFVQTSDNGFAIAATSADKNVLLIKTNASRDVEWQKTYGTGFGNAVISTSDGGFAIAASKITGTGSDAQNTSWLIKTDYAGNLQWSKEYVGSSFDGIVNASDGGYLMLGRFSVNGTEHPGFLKVDNAGNQQWLKAYTRSEADIVRLYTLIATSDGGYASVGEIQYSSSGVFMRNGWLIKTDQNGNIQVNRPFQMDGWTVFNSLAQANDGGFMLVGGTANASDTPYAACLIRTDGDGHSLWSVVNQTVALDGETLPQETGESQYYSIGKLNSGNFVVTGSFTGRGISSEIITVNGTVMQLETGGLAGHQITYVIPVAQGVFEHGFAYIQYANGEIILQEEYSYVPD